MSLQNSVDKTEEYSGYPEELAARILEETPEAIDAFNNLEEMIQYIRDAMAANYILAPSQL
jgi:hypothetical protein